MNVKLNDGLIFVEHTKSGKPRQIPINGQLRGTLLECFHRAQNEYVFLNDEGKKYKDVRTAFTNALKRAKLPSDFRFHDLRHTFASQMVMAGIDLVTVREILGHSNIKTTMRYAHLSPVHKREALEILGSRLKVRIDSRFRPLSYNIEGGGTSSLKLGRGNDE
jgi:integrase